MSILIFLVLTLSFKIIPYKLWTHFGNCTGSMKPNITCNCVGILKDINPQEVEANDIIRFTRVIDGEDVLHRAKKPCLIEQTYFYNDDGKTIKSIYYLNGWLTQGDNTINNDGCIPYSNINQKLIGWWCLGLN